MGLFCIILKTFFQKSCNTYSFSYFSSYGFLNHFRVHPEMLLSNQLQFYCLDPVKLLIVIATDTDFNKCNGVMLSEDGKFANMYVFTFSIPTQIIFDMDP